MTDGSYEDGRDQKGRFAVGRSKTGGRQLGVLNKFSKSIKERVAEGFDDPESIADGIRDFVKDLKVTNKAAASVLLKELMGSSYDQSSSSGGVREVNVNILSIPHDMHFSEAQCNLMMDQSVTLEEKIKITAELIAANMIKRRHGTGNVEIDAVASDASKTFDAEFIEIEALAPPLEPEPMSERDRIMQRAKEMGYTPLPPRPRRY